MRRQPIEAGTERTGRTKRYIRVVLSEEDRARLCGRAPTASGGLQSLIRRLQAGIRIRNDRAVLTLSEEDAERIPRYWANTGGKPGAGGYQRMLPMVSLRPYLPTSAPLFGAVSAPPRRGTSYVYFKREGLIGEGRIKIGRGTWRRASTGRQTDNPRELVVLLRLEEEPGRDERYFHAKFAKFRVCPQQEWFWPGDELMRFIREEAAKQELSE